MSTGNTQWIAYGSLRVFILYKRRDKFIAYFIQLNKYIKTLNPCEIRASRSFLIVEMEKTEDWLWEMIRHHRLNQGGS